MARARKFYVYRIYDGAVTVYIGKGSGRRLKQQMQRFSLQGEIIERFCSEKLAYKAECQWIKELKPTDNQNAGGGGSYTVRKKVRRTKEEIEMERVGTRVYAARMLLRFDLRGRVAPEQISRIREIAMLSEVC